MFERGETLEEGGVRETTECLVEGIRASRRSGWRSLQAERMAYRLGQVKSHIYSHYQRE